MAGPDQERPDPVDKPGGTPADAGGGGNGDEMGAEQEPAEGQAPRRRYRNRRRTGDGFEVVYLAPGQRIEEGW